MMPSLQKREEAQQQCSRALHGKFGRGGSPSPKGIIVMIASHPETPAWHAVHRQGSQALQQHSSL